MKKNKLKIITILLAIILIATISIFGIYKKMQNRMENIVKDYTYSMELKGARNVRLVASEGTREIIKDAQGNIIESATEEEIEQNGYTKEEQKINEETVLTKENYQRVKEIIEKRLENLAVDEYSIAVDEQTGDILIKIPENNNTDTVVGNLNTAGVFKIVDSKTNEVLLDGNDIKLSNVLYSTDSLSNGQTGTYVYLNIEFTKSGAEKINQISKDYKTIEETNTQNTTEENSTQENTTTEESQQADQNQVAENTNTEANQTNVTSEQASTQENTQEEQEQKQVKLLIDDTTLMETSFDEEITTGKMQLSIGQVATDQETLEENVQRATNIATLLDSGNMPIVYEVEDNKYIISDITTETLKYVEIGFIILIILIFLILAIKYKALGILGGFSIIGFVSLLTLVIRYTNVVISIESIFAIILSIALNIIIVKTIIKNVEKSENVKKDIYIAYSKTLLKMIPICIFSIIACFINWVPINSFGMVMFWGFVLMTVYNFAITNTLIIEQKK